jgi:hypothetical protein
MRRVALRPSASAQSAAAMNHAAKFCTLPAATYLVARDKGQGSRHFPSSCRRCWSAERMLQLSGCALPALRCAAPVDTALPKPSCCRQAVPLVGSPPHSVTGQRSRHQAATETVIGERAHAAERQPWHGVVGGPGGKARKRGAGNG